MSRIRGKSLILLQSKLQKMPVNDQRVDDYIEKSAEFAKPILIYLRELIHETCPEVEEGWKWSFPNFIYKGKILCSMSAFKHHCAFGFWLEKEMKTMKVLTKNIEKNSMFSLGKITKISDLPSKPQLKAAIKEAFKTQLEGKGFSMVEVLSTCPTNWGLSAIDAVKWMETNMMPYYPLGVFKTPEEVAK